MHATLTTTVEESKLLKRGRGPKKRFSTCRRRKFYPPKNSHINHNESPA